MAEKHYSGSVKKRIGILLFLFACITVLFTTKLFSIQVLHTSYYRKEGELQRLKKSLIDPKRGNVYDKSGKELTLSLMVPSVYAMPYKIKNSSEAAEILSEVLGMNEHELEQKLSNKKRYFLWIKRRVQPWVKQKLMEKKVQGVDFVDEPKRFYPKNVLLCHTLGFTGVDNQGLWGLESQYDSVLRGKKGTRLAETDSRGNLIPSGYYKEDPVTDGDHLFLNISEDIQHIAEREVDKAWKSHHARGALIIVMEPDTGYILALASRPVFDPNSATKFSHDVWKNPAVSLTYEPGSTFKVILAAAAIKLGMEKEAQTYCPGSIKVGKHTLHCAHHQSHGAVNLSRIIEKSCNVGAATLGMRIGMTKLIKVIRDFGFGARTKIDLPGEEAGILLAEKYWSTVNTANVAFGQGIGVTPIQLLTAVNAVANGGKLMKPQIVHEIRSPEGEIIKTFHPQLVRKVMNAEAARKLAGYLQNVIENGTGKNAQVDGFTAAGKTGTAQKVVHGRYGEGKFISSFVGFVPAKNPKLSILVLVDEPQGDYLGGAVAAPVFQSVARDSLLYLGAAPDNIAFVSAKTMKEKKKGSPAAKMSD